MRFVLATCGLTTLLVGLAFPALAQELLAVRAGRIITAAGEDIVDGTLLIEQGKITAVGKDIDIPFDAKVLRFPEGVVVPGFIECHTQAGLRVSNENLPVVPYISVMDGIDPIRKDFPNALREGITTLHIIPGNQTRIGGQGAILRPVGATVDDMLIKTPSAIKLSLSPGFRATRMTHMAAMRRDFMGLYKYLEGLIPKGDPKELAEKGTGAADLVSLARPRPNWKELDFEKIPQDEIDAQRKPFVKLIRGEIPAFIYCGRASDVLKAFELMDDHNIKGTLVLGQDAHRAKDLLRSRKDLGPVVLDWRLEELEIDPDTEKETRHLTAKILFDAGIKFAITSRPMSRGSFNPDRSTILSVPGAYHLWYQAATLVRQGLTRQEAILAITLRPAEVLGLEHRMGSLEVGKDANFSVFTGDIFDVRSWVDRVFIEGKEVYTREKDRELSELLRKREKKF